MPALKGTRMTVPDGQPPESIGDSETLMAPESRMSIDQAVRLAVRLQQQLDFDTAEGIYREILQVMPDHPDVLHFYGVLHHQRGDTENGCRMIARALDLAPDYLDAHNNLGNMYLETDRPADAEACYRKVIGLDDTNAGAYNNLGSVLRALGRPEEARQAYERAIALAPEFAAPRMNLGHLMKRQGRLAEAAAHYAHCILLDPAHAASRRHLGVALSCLGRLDEAADVFSQWLESEPDNPEARHLLAACSGRQVPQRAPDDYVREVFNDFAATFEERLALLDYRAPQLVADAVRQACGPATGALTILDAGCGTGLCGPYLKPYARRLVGVDLAPGMLKRAVSTGVYDSLREAELTTYLDEHPEGFDLVVSADTLCYFGDLSAVLSAARRSLTRQGRLIFSLETDCGEATENMIGYRIEPHGRYCHQAAYVRKTIAEAGLVLAELQHETLRLEMGRPVAGMVITARK